MTCIGQTGDVIVWGARQKVTTPRGHELTVLPLVDPGSAASIINEAYTKEFGFDIVVGFMDAFGIEYLNNLRVPVIGWIPIDGPFTTKWASYVRGFHRIVAYSHFGYEELLKWFPPSRIDYVGHGIPDVFSPHSKDKARESLEERYGIPKEGFLVTNVGANVGMRKELPLMMKTFARFVKDGHRDAHLFIHTNAYGSWPRGYDLLSWRHDVGMDENIHFPVYDPILLPASNEELAEIHSAADIYWQNSVAEGFGLPIAEAMACGTPAMVPDNSAQVEFIVNENGLQSRGFLIDSLPEDVYEQIPVYVPQLTNYPIPDQRSALKILKLAYKNPDLLKEKGQVAQQYIEKFHRWDTVIQGWFRVLDEVEEELELFDTIKNSFYASPI